MKCFGCIRQVEPPPAETRTLSDAGFLEASARAQGYCSYQCFRRDVERLFGSDERFPAVPIIGLRLVAQ